MTDEERRRLGETRRLVFSNVANGVPREKIREAMRLSDLEIDQALQAVGRKIAGFLVLEKQAPIDCGQAATGVAQVEREIRLNRRALLAVVARLGDMNLGTDVILIRDPQTKLVTGALGKVTTQAIDHPEMVHGVSHRIAQRGMGRK